MSDELFTPARYDGLPGMRFPGHPSYYPTKGGVGRDAEHVVDHLASTRYHGRISGDIAML